MMKNKILTAISAIMVFVPWTIFLLRMNDWALQSPTAEIMIGCYMVFMVLSGIFSGICYAKRNVKNKLMQICMVINVAYAFVAIFLAGVTIYAAVA